MRRVVVLLVILVSVAVSSPASADPGLRLAPPVPGRVLTGFDRVGRYEAGHRGVDLAGSAGEPVLAAAEGRVYFAGSVAGTPTVSIDHGNGWRTTYQPVAALVREGEAVAEGERIGTLRSGHCAPAVCLHWGLTDGTDHADPLAYLVAPVVRLLPRGARPHPPPRIGAATTEARVSGLPVDGRLTSPFGIRRHPITGVVKLHDGTDIAAPCGTPVTAPSAGRVTRTGYHPAYGWRVFVDHGGGLVTAYNHLPSVEVRVGAALAAGQRLGSVGSTGLSTGCHLHWMAWRGGRLIDPLMLLD